MLKGMRDLDPRAWNLFVGLSLAAGCSVPSQSDDGEASGTEASGGTETSGDTTTGDGDGDGETTTSEDNETSGDTTTGDGDDGETTAGPCACEDDEDCQTPGCKDFCYLGHCVNYLPCYSYNCGTFEVCKSGECTPLGEPAFGCGFGFEFNIPTVHELGAPPLALSFVDIDDDGEDELVVATETELLVYESDSNVPTVSPRIPAVADETRIVAGHFDAQPGEDVTLLVEGEYHRYFSDSAASLVAPIVEPCPLLAAEDLLAGDFDGQPPTDLLVWGNQGALLELTDETVLLSSDRIRGAAAYEYGSADGGVLLLRSTNPILFDFRGNQLATGVNLGSEVGRLRGIGQSKYFGVFRNDPYFARPWYEVRVFEASTLDEASLILFAQTGVDYDPQYGPDGGVAAGDFDGDQYDDIIVSYGWAHPLDVVFSAGSQPCIASQDLGPDDVGFDIAVGDHDGDGDDEAALTQGDRVLIVDLE